MRLVIIGTNIAAGASHGSRIISVPRLREASKGSIAEPFSLVWLFCRRLPRKISLLMAIRKPNLRSIIRNLPKEVGGPNPSLLTPCLLLKKPPLPMTFHALSCGLGLPTRTHPLLVRCPSLNFPFDRSAVCPLKSQFRNLRSHSNLYQDQPRLLPPERPLLPSMTSLTTSLLLPLPLPRRL